MTKRKPIPEKERIKNLIDLAAKDLIGPEQQVFKLSLLEDQVSSFYSDKRAVYSLLYQAIKYEILYILGAGYCSLKDPYDIKNVNINGQSVTPAD